MQGSSTSSLTAFSVMYRSHGTIANAHDPLNNVELRSFSSSIQWCYKGPHRPRYAGRG